LPRPKKSFSPEFRDEAVKMVIETSRPIARVAKELGINEGTLGNWVNAYRREHAGEEPPLTVSERARLREPMPAALGETVEDWLRSWLRCVIVPGCRLAAPVSCEMGEAPARSVIVYVPLLRRSLTCLLLTPSRRMPCPFRAG
jgi:transposase-like protein